MKLIKALPLILLICLSSTSVQGYELTGSFQNLSGQMVDISTFEGEPLVIETIQTTCSVCKNSDHRSNMDALYNTFNSQVQFLVVTINSQDTLEIMKQFVEDYNIKWIAGLDLNDVLQSQLGITGTPTTVLLDSDGNIRRSWAGIYLLDDYVNAINELVDEPQTLSTTSTNDNNGGGSGDGNSIIGDIFGNPIFQVGLVGILVLMVYFRSTKAS
jgi:hypothetical protein